MMEIRALLGLRSALLRRSLLRRIRYARVYLDWQAVVIYLYGAAFVLSAPVYYVIFPEQIPAPTRETGALLLAIAVLLLPAWTLFRGLFLGIDKFPSTVPVGDVQFVLSAPITPRVFLADRVIWSAVSNAILSLPLMVLSWLMAHTFRPEWHWQTSCAIGGIFFTMSVAADATAMLIYSVPKARRAMALVRLAVFGAASLLGLRVFVDLLSVSLEFPTLPVPPSVSLLPAELVGRAALPLLASGCAWAMGAVGLLLLFGRPDYQDLTRDAFGALERRIARLARRVLDHRSGHGAARSSLGGWWAKGRTAIVWRQLASYRHLPWRVWPSRLFRALVVLTIPMVLRWRGSSHEFDLMVLFPVLTLVSTAVAFAAGWRDEIRLGLTRRLLPVPTHIVVEGWALGPALIVGFFGSAGTLLLAARDHWGMVQTLSAIFLSLGGGFLSAALALHEEWSIEISTTGVAEGVRAGKTTTMVIGGATVLIANSLAQAFTPSIAMFLTGLLAASGAFFLLRYMAFSLAGSKVDRV